MKHCSTISNRKRLEQPNCPSLGNGTRLQYSCLKIPWMEEPGRLQSMGSLWVGHDWATSLLLFAFMHWRRKWQPTPVFLPGESQGQRSLVGCRLWGCAQSLTRLKRLSSSRGPVEWTLMDPLKKVLYLKLNKPKTMKLSQESQEPILSALPLAKNWITGASENKSYNGLKHIMIKSMTSKWYQKNYWFWHILKIQFITLVLINIHKKSKP